MDYRVELVLGRPVVLLFVLISDFRLNVQFKLDVLLGMMGDLQQSMGVIMNMGIPELVLEEPCTTVQELEEMSHRLGQDHIFKQRLVRSCI